jgi:uncharacterized protein (TIGR02145 family)
MDDKTKGTFTDPRDGKVYKTVRLGGVVWMAENLNFAAEGSVCYENDEANGDKYGRLYDWETAKKACPDGWRLPTEEEWTALVDYAGGVAAGTTLKSTAGWNEGPYHGITGMGNGTDDFGFSALPGGNGSGNGNFYEVGISGKWWSATEFNADKAFGRSISYSTYYVDSSGRSINILKMIREYAGRSGRNIGIKTLLSDSSLDIKARLRSVMSIMCIAKKTEKWSVRCVQDE